MGFPIESLLPAQKQLDVEERESVRKTLESMGVL